MLPVNVVLTVPEYRCGTPPVWVLLVEPPAKVLHEEAHHALVRLMERASHTLPSLSTAVIMLILGDIAFTLTL